MLVDKRPTRKIVEDQYVVQVLYLISQGIPFDVAWALPMHQAQAWSIIMREFHGDKVWNWATERFEKVEDNMDTLNDT